MLQIGYLIICEDVIKEQGQTIIQKPFPVLTPLNLPGNFSFKVAFSLHNLTEEHFGKENILKVMLKDSNGKDVVNTGDLNLQTNPNSKPDGSSVEIAEADISFNNVEFYTDGIYSLTLTVNENEQTLKIPVIKRNQQNE